MPRAVPPMPCSRGPPILAVLAHPQLVVDVLDAHHLIAQVLGHVLGAPAVHGSRERHVSFLDAHVDVARVDVRVAVETIVELFRDPLVGAPVVLGPKPKKRPIDSMTPAPSPCSRVSWFQSRSRSCSTPVRTRLAP